MWCLCDPFVPLLESFWTFLTLLCGMKGEAPLSCVAALLGVFGSKSTRKSAAFTSFSCSKGCKPRTFSNLPTFTRKGWQKFKIVFFHDNPHFGGTFWPFRPFCTPKKRVAGAGVAQLGDPFAGRGLKRPIVGPLVFQKTNALPPSKKNNNLVAPCVGCGNVTDPYPPHPTPQKNKCCRKSVQIRHLQAILTQNALHMAPSSQLAT